MDGNIGKVKITFAASEKKGKVYLKWRNVSGIKGYQVQYSEKRTFSVKRTKKTKGCSMTLKGLGPNRKYYIRIRAYSQGRKRSYGKWSKVRTVKIK